MFVISCESSKEIDSRRFNAKIAHNTAIATPEALIVLYYDYPTREGTPNLQLSKKEIGPQHFEITLIHDNLDDDSVKAIKIDMTAKRIGNTWQVQKILKSWKCYDGRDHTDWSSQKCS
ncbi:hypothetical protein HUK80_14460 [Flavobacterium sp. MAH-1]|uniref:Uncharacterized protein n=1 Tax=Flavobacterium agri TaxID=2743471 RepID=A0A7Y8Y4A8_9FLAO|nr:hypothetical protein [Flavobacterium agri]NUY82103.1 hypothetical protein [Flavobacterium agri]NYA72127.1 hypothetical protein [Flavobacterium agri]